MANFNKAKDREKKSGKKWYVIHGKKYSYFIWAIPFIPFIELHDYLEDRKYKAMIWDEKKATKVLDRVLPKVLEWVEEDNAYYYCMDWGLSSFEKFAPRKLRKWARKFRYDLQKFVKDGYESESHIKTIEEDNYNAIWVKFVEKEEE